MRISEVGLEGTVVCGCRLPRVPSGNEVEENYAERPDVIEERRVALCGSKLSALAF